MRRLPLIVVAFLVVATAWAVSHDAPAQEYPVGCAGVASCAGVQAAETVEVVRYAPRLTLFQRIRANRLARVQARIESRQAVMAGCGG